MYGFASWHSPLAAEEFAQADCTRDASAWLYKSSRLATDAQIGAELSAAASASYLDHLKRLRLVDQLRHEPVYLTANN